ncbi:MAG: hypothetical protein V3T17_03415 [Pseudomonadales bacterium]
MSLTCDIRHTLQSSTKQLRIREPPLRHRQLLIVHLYAIDGY